MPVPDEEFQRELMAAFRGEASEHIGAVSAGLIEIEKTADETERAPIVERVFREVHSLKGAARSVGLAKVETVCQSLEAILSRAKRRETTLDPDSLDVLHRAMDEVGRLLGTPGAQTAAGGESVDPGPAAYDPDETVRVPSNQLDRLLLQVEELIPSSIAVANQAQELAALARVFEEWKREERSVAPDDPRSDSRLEFGARLNSVSEAAERNRHSLKVLVDTLNRDTKLLLLRPFTSLTEHFPRLVRDLCRAQGKEASLDVVGDDTRIDRRILQEIKDPLIHILRNGIDHGIEKPGERERAGKPPRGAISVIIEQVDANSMELTISDDGAGIDPDKLRVAVVKAGILDAESVREIDDRNILPYIFRSGVSTSPIVTDISGWGLGMAIVREKVEKLGGYITLKTELGKGTSFKIFLALTVSTLRGLLVRSGEQEFIIPLTFVERAILTPRNSVLTVENQATVILDGETIPFALLHDVLGLPPNGCRDAETAPMPTVVLTAIDQRIAFRVDKVFGEQETLVKSLGPQLARVRNVGGAAVLETGKVVPILNVADLMKSAVKGASRPKPEEPIEEGSVSRRMSILVVDDSITARKLFKNILEAEGYLVRTAGDGIEAFATLRETKFDLVVSDVEMPRMNGFELTARIRSDKRLADMPVILVTALESREDKERGIDAGASAYIVKSSFEQSNLLEIVRRFL